MKYRRIAILINRKLQQSEYHKNIGRVEATVRTEESILRRIYLWKELIKVVKVFVILVAMRDLKILIGKGSQ